jgi:hypothetical protein
VPVGNCWQEGRRRVPRCGQRRKSCAWRGSPGEGLRRHRGERPWDRAVFPLVWRRQSKMAKLRPDAALGAVPAFSTISAMRKTARANPGQSLTPLLGRRGLDAAAVSWTKDEEAVLVRRLLDELDAIGWRPADRNRLNSEVPPDGRGRMQGRSPALFHCLGRERRKKRESTHRAHRLWPSADGRETLLELERRKAVVTRIVLISMPRSIRYPRNPLQCLDRPVARQQGARETGELLPFDMGAKRRRMRRARQDY